MRVFIYDTTLRDGTQGETISLSVDDKLLIARKLDELGVDYVEGGWPGSNPRDRDFFERVRGLDLKHARIAAFGSTRYPRNTVEEDPNVQALLEAETPVVTIFGKSWNLHTEKALGVSEEQNLAMISETVGYVKQHDREVIYDAEHFFDGYNSHPDFALRTLEAAQKAGADVLVLCDTNGGLVTQKLSEIFAEVRSRFDGVIGIHTHNDSELAVANTVAAVELGATHVQGTINGYGERCGNANLCSILPVLELKLGHTTIGAERLEHLTGVANFVSDVANLSLPNDRAFVGRSAFAHKGGIHVSAVNKESSTYEHVDPDLVGNRRRVLISDLSGRSNISYKLREKGLDKLLDDAARRQLLDRIKQLEFEGYELESAEGTFELLVREVLQPDHFFFELEDMRVTDERQGHKRTRCRVEMTLRARDGVHSAEVSASGPFDAMAQCLRKCLSQTYPSVADIRLVDYKVRVLEPNRGTAAKVRVLIEWSDHKRSWTTVGVSDDVLEASWNALVDSVRLELLRLAETDRSLDKTVADYSWGV
jgi:2-isopropylmalate synthase